jgi:hypothetical protein
MYHLWLKDYTLHFSALPSDNCGPRLYLPLWSFEGSASAWAINIANQVCPPPPLLALQIVETF